MGEQFYCSNCQRYVSLDKHGYCEHCGSDALIPAAIIEISNPIPKPQQGKQVAIPDITRGRVKG